MDNWELQSSIRNINISLRLLITTHQPPNKPFMEFHPFEKCQQTSKLNNVLKYERNIVRKGKRDVCVDETRHCCCF